MKLLKTNKTAFIAAFLVGLLYVAPHLFFISSLGSAYQGIPMMPSANEPEYMYKIRDVLDGHALLGSPLYYEYKDQMPMMIPVGEYLYALPALFLQIPLADVLVASKFILPAVLFLLVYFLFLTLTDDADARASKISALSAGALVTLGYDLVDFRTAWHALLGQRDVLNDFTFVWARPVNPILGALFLLAFLIAISALWRHTATPRRSVVLSACLLTLMFGIYFFSWGMSMSILGVLFLLSLLNKRFETARHFGLVVLLWLVFSIPYWWVMWNAKQSPWYAASKLRHGLFLTHYPLINKLLVVTAGAFALSLCLRWYRSRSAFRLESWYWFSLAIIIGSFVSYNQQVITGRTVWPFHFVQYSIPLCLIVLVLLLHHEVRPRLRAAWIVATAMFLVIPTAYGVYAQRVAYADTAIRYEVAQSYAPAFQWLDQQAGDCVVLVDFNTPVWHDLTAYVADFSHCDVYARDWHFSLLPFERSRDDYMIQLRWQGVGADEIGAYLADHRGEATGYLFGNWKSLYGVGQFPDVSDPALTQRLQKFPEQYLEYMKQDLGTALKKYRLDYIMSVGPLPERLLRQLPGVTITFQANNIFIYRFE